ncbi:MAG: fused MFS/spermidine synthase [Pseudomonadota bacterium]
MAFLSRVSEGSASLARLSQSTAGLLAFAAALLVSATLLFSIQPMFSRMILPVLGGSPSVWAVAMCFFQAALLAGYCYAHVLNHFASPRAAFAIHLTVLALAATTLPFGLPVWADSPPAGNPYLWLVWLLTVGVGVPFFAVSANAPLLQAWFARSSHPHAHDPYFLYGASNLGSLAGLLAYPVIIEPLLGLDMQRQIWSVGYLALIGTIGCCGFLMLAAGTPARAGAQSERGQPDVGNLALPAVSSGEAARWIGLSFVPSALLVAFTTHITTDVASAPLLWVVPLATFLGTFVVVFREQSLIPDIVCQRLQPLLVAASLILIALQGLSNGLVHGVVGYATFVVTVLVCHRALYLTRPSADRLTVFYLLMSFGGVLGGIFAALVAPQLFTSVIEYPVLMLAGLLAHRGWVSAWRDPEGRSQIVSLVPLAALVFACGVGSAALGSVQATASFAAPLWLIAIFGGTLSIAVFGVRGRVSPMVGVAIALIGAFTLGGAPRGELYAERSFFGVSRVIEKDDGQLRLYAHGSTIHGLERVRDETGATGPFPTASYYHPKAPMVQGLVAARAHHADDGRALRIAVIGQGTGSMACHTQPGENLTFFEIDPVVDRISRNPNYFSFIARCAPQAVTKIGDARVVLEKDRSAQFDYLLVDAFSSDAIPVHLLTREALELYVSRVRRNGLVALHVSNRHLDLERVVVATARTIPGLHLVHLFDSDSTKLPRDGKMSRVVFLSRSEQLINSLRALDIAEPVKADGIAPWTDDYADLFSAIVRRYTQ